jgi:hypothetical protein
MAERPNLVSVVDAAIDVDVPARQIYTWIEEERLTVHRPPETDGLKVELAQVRAVASAP